MKAIKTYGIYGLLEWHGYVEGNGVKMKVDFTNGSATAWGVAPATFTTKHELTQLIIENSDMFKKGRIKIVRSTPLPEENKAETKAKPATAQPKPAETQPETPAEAAMPQGESDTRVITVADKADAIEWLKENYADKGYTATKLRTQTAFEEACKECNVDFRFNE